MATRRFGISTHLYHGERLERSHLFEVAAHGFDTVEIFATRTHFDYHDPEAIDRLADWLADAKLTLHSIHAPIFDSLKNDTWGRPFSNATRNENARAATIRETAAALAIARRIPVGFLVIHVGIPAAQRPGPEDNSRAAAIRSIEEIHRMAGPLGAQVALEVMGNDLSTAPSLVSLIEDELDLSAIGICMDVGHAFLLGDPVEAIETASGHLITTHIHDNRRQHDDHLVPLEGGIDWPSTLMAMEKIGYDGVFMLEVRNADSPAAVLERAARACQRLERMLQ